KEKPFTAAEYAENAEIGSSHFGFIRFHLGVRGGKTSYLASRNFFWTMKHLYRGGFLFRAPLRTMRVRCRNKSAK
ncbi:MAG: hypothetical protein QOF56_1230, partial [Acidobacteriaceae bacterium]|nr:hypothetical protein [Acidobacteriaceae bacterium]